MSNFATFCFKYVSTFLIIGTTKNTRDKPDGQWTRNGQPWHFDYLEEKCIASGDNEQELRESAAEYKRLLGMTMEQYLREVNGLDNAQAGT